MLAASKSLGGVGLPELNERILTAIQAQGASLESLARSSEQQTRSLGQMHEGLTLLLERQGAAVKAGNVGAVKDTPPHGVSLANTIGMLAAVAAIGGVMLSGISSTVFGMNERMESDNRREMTDAYSDGRRDERLDNLESELHSRTTHERRSITENRDG